MSLISEKDQQALQKLFEGLEGDVTITNFTQRESLLIIPSQECDLDPTVHQRPGWPISWQSKTSILLPM